MRLDLGAGGAPCSHRASPSLPLTEHRFAAGGVEEVGLGKLTSKQGRHSSLGSSGSANAD
jgi:hypothetical protein